MPLGQIPENKARKLLQRVRVNDLLCSDGYCLLASNGKFENIHERGARELLADGF